MAQDYERRCADRVNGRAGVIGVKIAPGRIRGDRSMSSPEGAALSDWIADFRRFMGMIRR